MPSTKQRLGFFLLTLVYATLIAAADLEIHTVNVGWGTSVVVKGPDGTTVLMDSGHVDRGGAALRAYLPTIGIRPSDGFDYTIVGHQHDDHLGGFADVIGSGATKYDVHEKNFFNGSSYTGAARFTSWRTATRSTSAGPAVAMTPGTRIPLGGGAILTCVAANGRVLGRASALPNITNENDKSIAVLIQYGGFDYFWASDLGGGITDAACTGRSTTQQDVESAVIKAISPRGASPMITDGGIDVLHVSHHGSTSSTNATLMNFAAPAVALISTGDGQETNFQFPRRIVVEDILMANATCITVTPALVLQSEEGRPFGSRATRRAFSVGNIVIRTDGVTTFTASADGAVTEGPNEVVSARLPRTFTLDDLPSEGPMPVALRAPVAAAVAQPAAETSFDDQVRLLLVRITRLKLDLLDQPLSDSERASRSAELDKMETAARALLELERE